MAKTQHVKEKAQKQAGQKINCRVEGSVLTGFFVVGPDGDPLDINGEIDLNVMTGETGKGQIYANMWDAINARKRFDSGPA